ncbi:MAG: tRNA (guanine-N(7)-)-methyltransferase, partial [Actinomyces urogenitalis DORA_12]
IRTVAADFRLDPQEVFGHVGQVRPVVVEVGSGGGEALLAHAAANPGTDHLAVEVWETSIAKIVRDAAKAGLDNVRVVPADASQLLATALPVGCASEVWVFFPDPWRKPRHRKRRLVTAHFADSVARVLRGGGVWRLATDWADYAWQMRDVLEDVSALPEGLEADMTEPYFRYDGAGRLSELGADTWEQDSLGNGPDPGSPSGTVGGWSPRFEGRVLTRFEQRGIEAGRTIRDLTAVRTETTWKPERSEAMLVALDRRAGTRREARSGRSLA